MAGPELDRVFARCFRGADGEAALAYLRGLTVEIAAGPEIEDRRLRHLEGQRFIVRTIINMVERGRK